MISVKKDNQKTMKDKILMHNKIVCLSLVALILSFSALTALGCRGGATSNMGEEIEFPDRYFEAAIREAIDKSRGPIHTSELEEITSLDVRGRYIEDITGLEHCRNLTRLTLVKTSISDISPLTSLTNLIQLTLVDSQISDISPLASLTDVTYLYLENNQISDVFPLLSLNKLLECQLKGNPLSTTSMEVYLPQLQKRGVNLGSLLIPDEILGR